MDISCPMDIVNIRFKLCARWRLWAVLASLVYNVSSEVCIVSHYVQVTMYFDPLLYFVYYVSIACGM
jgi:Na+-transporting NADH:ubiquinone oxidoreductase subunit NqrB